MRSTAVDQSGLTVTVLAVASTSAVVSLLASYLYRKQRTQWKEEDDEKYGSEALHSIIAHFKSLNLDPETTVEEANKRRTTAYYEKAREAHLERVVPGVGSYSTLMYLREKELQNIHYYHTQGTKSHRTVVVMCDSTTSSILKEAREKILTPLNYSTDSTTAGVWIPEVNLIPEQDMHVTVALPWWWHTMREGNYELSKDLASRFRQTLLLKFHHAFQIELERIVLLGGRTLVALWRCVGERITEDGQFIYDRHGESVDPFIRLRMEIVRCFTTESADLRGQPLTYSDSTTLKSPVDFAKIPKPQKVKRQHTIEEKTPGIIGKDGFIHTTLCRIPLDCISKEDVSLDEVHRLCREASATLSGHRMVVSKFRFLETTGRGGEQSNPCVEPIFDETIEAPTRVEVDRARGVNEIDNLHTPKVVNTSTIGAVPNTAAPKTVIGLFETTTEEVEEEDDDDDSVVEITASILM